MRFPQLDLHSLEHVDMRHLPHSQILKTSLALNDSGVELNDFGVGLLHHLGSLLFLLFVLLQSVFHLFCLLGVFLHQVIELIAEADILLFELVESCFVGGAFVLAFGELVWVLFEDLLELLADWVLVGEVLVGFFEAGLEFEGLVGELVFGWFDFGVFVGQVCKFGLEGGNSLLEFLDLVYFLMNVRVEFLVLLVKIVQLVLFLLWFLNLSLQ